MHTVVNLIVEEPNTGQRLDVFLHAALTGLGQDVSRAGVQRWIKEGFVTQNTQVSANPAKKVRLGEEFAVNVPAAVATELVGEDIPLDILFEDDQLIVLNKPAGLTVHPAPGNWTGTLVQALIHHCGTSLSGINGEARPGIVHRIDKDTSGIMVAAKTDVAHRGLAKQFAGHTINREYLALVVGNIMPPAGRVEGNIGRHPVHRLKRAVVDAGGKTAVTHYKTQEKQGERASLVACTLETGRTHQIRVHMAHLGHPLLNDPLYGHSAALPGKNVKGKLTDEQAKTLQTALKNLHGQALHAARLGFTHPTTGKHLEFTSPLPEAFQALLGTLKSL